MAYCSTCQRHEHGPCADPCPCHEKAMGRNCPDCDHMAAGHTHVGGAHFPWRCTYYKCGCTTYKPTAPPGGVVLPSASEAGVGR